MIEPGIEHLLKCLTSLAERLEPYQFLNVLSAWRGPDTGDPSVKGGTTEIIRREILNECREGAIGVTTVTVDGGLYGKLAEYFYGAKVAPRITVLDLTHSSSNHFNNHIQWAADNLDLKVRLVAEKVATPPNL